MWGKSSLFVLLLAVLALGANVRANDGNPCRHIEIYDPYLGGNAVFDLSSLIDVGPWTVNQTWNGIDWDLWSFGVCKPLEQACPNTEVGSTSVCGVPNKAGMCQRFTDPRHGQGSFCVASWNGTIAANLDGDGDRGLHVMYQPGDIRDEFRQNVNMLLNIECDPAVSNLKTEDIFVMPPFIGSNLFIVHFRHKAGCPTNVALTPAPSTPPSNSPNNSPNNNKKSSGMSGLAVGLIAIAMLLIGLFGGAFGGLYLNSKFAWFSDPHRQAAAYTQFELDEDI